MRTWDQFVLVEIDDTKRERFKVQNIQLILANIHDFNQKLTRVQAEAQRLNTDTSTLAAIPRAISQVQKVVQSQMNSQQMGEQITQLIEFQVIDSLRKFIQPFFVGTEVKPEYDKLDRFVIASLRTANKIGRTGEGLRFGFLGNA